MLRNLQEIQAHINNDAYCNHIGKIAESRCIRDLDSRSHKEIRNAVSENGFIIINVKNQPLLSMVRVLKKIFGMQIRDVGINAKYIAKVEASKNGKYYINTAFSQPLHTDEGYRKVFPRFVSLYCVRQSSAGGMSTIVKVDELLTELHKKFKNDVTNLFQPNFIQIDSPSGLIDKQILFPINETITGLSYSPILRNVQTTDLGYEMISFINQFIHEPSNQYRIMLKENDLLIMDNCRVLHGRTAFNENDKRLLLRLWNDSISLNN